MYEWAELHKTAGMENLGTWCMSEDKREVMKLLGCDEKYDQGRSSDFEQLAEWERILPLCAGMGSVVLYQKQLSLLGIHEHKSSNIFDLWREGNRKLEESDFTKKYDDMIENQGIDISNVMNQLLNQGKISIDIPKIEFYSPEHHISGYKLVEGKILTPEVFNKFTKEEQENLAKDIALFVKEMHALKLPDIEDLEINVLEDYKSDYEYLKENIYSLIPIEAQTYLDKFYKSILNNKNMINYKKVLCHNDLSCNHILIKNNKLSGIIDFGDVAITDADKDFVYLLIIHIFVYVLILNLNAYEETYLISLFMYIGYSNICSK